MNLLYAKALLYAYPFFSERISQIDKSVMKKALSARGNYLKPVMEQYEEIVNLTFEKKVICFVKDLCDRAFKKFTDNEVNLFRVKYSGGQEVKWNVLLDITPRCYYRLQKKLTERFADIISKYGLDDEYFIKECLPFDFFKFQLTRAKRQVR